MSTRKVPQDTATSSPIAVPVSRARKKARGARVRLTHLEVRRGQNLRLRIAVADDVLAEFGNELGVLIKKISPGTQEQTPSGPGPSEFVISRTHSDNDGDYHASVREHLGDYHASVREHLVDLFGSLCDTSLADAREIAREEITRRAEGRN